VLYQLSYVGPKNPFLSLASLRVAQNATKIADPQKGGRNLAKMLPDKQEKTQETVEKGFSRSEVAIFFKKRQSDGKRG
jgi:hypothetical protein